MVWCIAMRSARSVLQGRPSSTMPLDKNSLKRVAPSSYMGGDLSSRMKRINEYVTCCPASATEGYLFGALIYKKLLSRSSRLFLRLNETNLRTRSVFLATDFFGLLRHIKSIGSSLLKHCVSKQGDMLQRIPKFLQRTALCCTDCSMSSISMPRECGSWTRPDVDREAISHSRQNFYSTRGSTADMLVAEFC